MRLLLVIALMLLASPAYAHPPPIGIGGFWGGLLHPYLVTAHAAAIVALGLLVGQQGWGRVTPVAFILALMAGLGLIALALVPPYANEALLVLAAIIGLLVALPRPWPEPVGIALGVLTGVAVGLDSPPEVLSVREANLMLIGTGLGASLFLVLVTEGATKLTKPWQRIGARIAGSWIAAAAILVLALSFSR
jgi:urease accessory protein